MGKGKKEVVCVCGKGEEKRGVCTLDCLVYFIIFVSKVDDTQEMCRHIYLLSLTRESHTEPVVAKGIQRFLIEKETREAQLRPLAEYKGCSGGGGGGGGGRGEKEKEMTAIYNRRCVRSCMHLSIHLSIHNIPQRTAHITFAHCSMHRGPMAIAPCWLLASPWRESGDNRVVIICSILGPSRTMTNDKPTNGAVRPCFELFKSGQFECVYIHRSHWLI